MSCVKNIAPIAFSGRLTLYAGRSTGLLGFVTEPERETRLSGWFWIINSISLNATKSSVAVESSAAAEGV